MTCTPMSFAFRPRLILADFGVVPGSCSSGVSMAQSNFYTRYTIMMPDFSGACEGHK